MHTNWITEKDNLELLCSKVTWPRGLGEDREHTLTRSAHAVGKLRASLVGPLWACPASSGVERLWKWWSDRNGCLWIA